MSETEKKFNEYIYNLKKEKLLSIIRKLYQSFIRRVDLFNETQVTYYITDVNVKQKLELPKNNQIKDILLNLPDEFNLISIKFVSNEPKEYYFTFIKK